MLENLNKRFEKLGLVSVVIPSNNSEKTIETCLNSIKAQTYKNVEIIIADNYSTDKTRRIAENFGVRVVLCRGGRSRARNVGVNLAQGEFVLSLDSDMELTSNVINECVSKIKTDFDAVIIPEFSVGEGFWAECRALEKLCYVGDDLIEAARFFRKDVFESICGYDDKLVFGEDWDLNQRITAKYRIGRTNAFIKHHEGRLRLSINIKKKYQYGKTLHKYAKKNPKESKQQLSVIRPAFLKNWKKLCNDPSHAVGMLFMKACEFTAGFFGSLEAKMDTYKN